MTTLRVRAKVRVRLTLEVEVPDTWGGDCPLQQLVEQGARSAIAALRHGVSLNEGGPTGRPAATIIGTPQVIGMVTMEDQA